MMYDLSAKDWISEINRALEYRRKYALEDKWAELESLFYNVNESQANSGPNIVLSTGDALMSALTVPDPYVTVKASRVDYVPHARVLETVDNNFIHDSGMQAEVENIAINAYLFGVGIGKVGYDSEHGWDESLDIGTPLMGQPLGISLTQHDPKGRPIEFNTRIKPGMPWFRSILPHDFLVPWGTRTLDDAPWVAHRVVRHIDAIKGDVKYSRTRNLRPQMSMEDVVRSYQSVFKPYRVAEETSTSYFNESTHALEYVEMWEVRDKRTGRIFVVSHGHPHFLRNDTDVLQTAGLPYVSLSFTPKTRNFWTTSDAHYLRYHQAELNDIAVQRTKQRRANTLKFGYEEGSMDKEEILKMLSGDIGIAFRYRATEPGKVPIHPMHAGQPNVGLQMDDENVRRNAREMVGFSRNQIGEFEASGRRTATEASIVDQASNLRLDRRQAAIAKVYIESVKKINPILFDQWKAPRVVQIVGEDGSPQFLKVAGNDLRGDYVYRVGFSTGGNETLGSRRQFALQVLMSGMANPMFDPGALARFVSNAFNDPEFTSIFKPEVLSGQASQASALPAPAQGGGGMGMGGAGSGAGANAEGGM